MFSFFTQKSAVFAASQKHNDDFLITLEYRSSGNPIKGGQLISFKRIKPINQIQYTSTSSNLEKSSSNLEKSSSNLDKSSSNLK